MTPTSSIAQKARALLKGVTEGPWFASDWNEDDGPEPFTIEAREPEVLSAGQSSIWPNGIVKRRIASTEDGDGDRAAHARFIALAPTLISEMADALERAEAENARAKEQHQWLAGEHAKASALYVKLEARETELLAVLNAVRIMMKNRDQSTQEMKLLDAIKTVIANSEDAALSKVPGHE